MRPANWGCVGSAANPLAQMFVRHVVDEPSCSVCGQSYTILPCVICLQPIEHPASSLAEAYCRHALPLQMPCCGADAHEDCRAGFAAGRCCPCHMPLLAGVEGLDEECTSAQNYLFMRREQALVQQRRTKGQKDYGHPLGKIVTMLPQQRSCSRVTGSVSSPCLLPLSPPRRLTAEDTRISSTVCFRQGIWQCHFSLR